jgi:hypothetical protein
MDFLKVDNIGRNLIHRAVIDNDLGVIITIGRMK